jgi:hypothetical protein
MVISRGFLVLVLCFDPPTTAAVRWLKRSVSQPLLNTDLSQMPSTKGSSWRFRNLWLKSLPMSTMTNTKTIIWFITNWSAQVIKRVDYRLKSGVRHEWRVLPWSQSRILSWGPTQPPIHHLLLWHASYFRYTIWVRCKLPSHHTEFISFC